MALIWTLVATIAREADSSTTQQIGGIVSGDRVIMYMARAVPSVELWRSDDRGVTWNFYTVTGLTATTTGPSEVFDSKYWVASSSNQLLVHTPSSNPGAGGFTTESTTPISPANFPQAAVGASFLNLQEDTTPGTNDMWRRTGVGTFISIGALDDASLALKQIPGTGDLLYWSTDTIKRVTPNNPRVIVNTFNVPQATYNAAPVWGGGAVSSTEYYLSLSGVDSQPAKILRTTNGGTSWAETNPTADFWGAFAIGGTRKGHMSGYVSFGGTTYSYLTFKDSSVPDDDRKHVKLAKFDGTGWVPESDDTNDGFRVVHTLRGVNASGNMDFYAVTVSAATDTVKVYRTTVTQLAAGIFTSKALSWDFRELPIHGSRWTLHKPFPVGNAITTGGRGDPERIHYVRNDTPRLVEFPSGATDEGAAISWKWKSRAYAFGAMLWEKGIRQIAAVCLGTTGTIVVDLFEDLAAVAARTYSLVFTGTPHERKSTKRIHADVQARTIQVQLTGTADTFESSGLEVEPTRKRRPTNP